MAGIKPEVNLSEGVYIANGMGNILGENVEVDQKTRDLLTFMLSNMNDKRGIDVNYDEKRTSILIPIVYKEKERSRNVEGTGAYVLKSKEADGLGILELLEMASDEISKIDYFVRYEKPIINLFSKLSKLDSSGEEAKRWSKYAYEKVKNGKKANVDLKGVFGADYLMEERYPFAIYIGLSTYDPREVGFDFDIVTMGDLREEYERTKKQYERIIRELRDKENEYRKINRGFSKLIKRNERKRLEEEIRYSKMTKNWMERELEKLEQIFREIEKVNF